MSYMKTLILRFSKKTEPPLFTYPISIIHNYWLPSEEFNEVKNNTQKKPPHLVTEDEEMEWLNGVSLSKKNGKQPP